MLPGPFIQPILSPGAHVFENVRSAITWSPPNDFNVGSRSPVKRISEYGLSSTTGTWYEAAISTSRFRRATDIVTPVGF
jgi:hypothetical protein